MSNCFLCTEELKAGNEWQLQCSSCRRKLHYACGMGYDDPVKAFRTSGTKTQYKCPICIVAQRYSYIHLVLKMHELQASRLEEEEHGHDDDDDDAASNHSLTTNHSLTGVSSISDVSHVSHVSHVSQPVLDSGGISSATIQADSQLHTQIPDLALPSEQSRSRTSTRSSAEASFREVASDHERRRIKRCKGMLYGLKHISSSVDTLLVLDSNGRSIKSEDIDGEGDKVCLRQIGGLCVSATTKALKETKVKYPKIKHVGYGLGTNDHLHAQEHPGLKIDYIKELNLVTRKVFPNAKIHFILPFSAIEGLGAEYVHNLSRSITVAGVGWKIHQTPSMKSKLRLPSKIHLTPSGRVNFTLWLRKLFAPRRPTPSAHNHTAHAPSDLTPSAHAPRAHSQNTHAYGGRPSVHSGRGIQHPPTYSSVAAGFNRNELDLEENTRLNQPMLRMAGESTYNLDSFIKDRLYELVLGPRRSRSRSMNIQGWDG